MKARFHFLAQAALAGSLVAPLYLSPISTARAGNPANGETRPRPLPYHTPPSGNKAPPLGKLIAFESSPRAAEPQPAAPQRASGGGITLERLWDKWQGRRAGPQGEAPRTSQPSVQSPGRPNDGETLQLEAPQPVRPEGEFPVFRNDGQSPQPNLAPPQPAPVSIVEPPPARPTVTAADEGRRPTPAAGPKPVIAPVENRSVSARPIEAAPPENQPATARITVRTTEVAAKPIAPSAPPAPRRSTAAYLADDVRYGSVIRRTSSSTSIDPTAGILGDVDQPVEAGVLDRPTSRPSAARLPVARSAEASQANVRTADASFDTVFSREESGASPQAMPLSAEDVCPMASMLPAPSMKFRGSSAQEASLGMLPVSTSASPAMLQHALRHYGAPGGQELPPLRPVPSREPDLEQPIPATDIEISQRSVLLGGAKPIGINHANSTPAGNQGKGRSANKGHQGTVAGVDKEHGTILLQFPGNRLPAIGSTVQVYQKMILVKRDLLGEFRVIGVQGNAVVAQPIGKIDLELILPGDEAAAI